MSFSWFHLSFIVYRNIFVVRRMYRLKNEVGNGPGDAGTAAKCSHIRGAG